MQLGRFLGQALCYPHPLVKPELAFDHPNRVLDLGLGVLLWRASISGVSLSQSAWFLLNVLSLQGRTANRPDH